MRFLVFSDTHRHTERMEEIILQQMARTDAVIHLGDEVTDAEYMREKFPELPFSIVGGNSDYTYPVQEQVLEMEGKRIFLTHGHTYHVKFGYAQAIEAARQRSCDVLLFGHTHLAYECYDNGLYIMNPGSLTLPADRRHSYGVLDISASGMTAYPVFL